MNLPINSKSQCKRIIDYLQANAHGATTLELVKELDVLRPGARVCELRQEGYNIMTHWEIVHTALGTHKNARYVLLNGTQNVN